MVLEATDAGAFVFADAAYETACPHDGRLGQRRGEGIRVVLTPR
jgi:hypothetical protein